MPFYTKKLNKNYFFETVSNSINFKIKLSKFSICNILGPSLGATSGLGYGYRNKTSAPTATAAFDRAGTYFLSPPLLSPIPPGDCTE